MSVFIKSRISASSAGTAAFQIEQTTTHLRLRSREPWERLRLLAMDGSTHRESTWALADFWELSGLQPGVYWVVGEWSGTRSSRAVIIGG